MFPSNIYTRCWRCNQGISERSAMAVHLWAMTDDDSRLYYDIVMANSLGRDDIALHMTGDRECTKEVSGFHGKILKRCDLPMSCDTSFLDSI